MPENLDSSGSNSSPVKQPKIQPRRALRSESRYLPEASITTAEEMGRSPERNAKPSGPNKIHSFSDEGDSSKEENQSTSRCEVTNSHLSTPATAPSVAKKDNSWMVIAVAVTVIVAACAYIFAAKSESVIVLDAKVDCSLLMELENNFPNQDRKLFKSLKIGIESVLNEVPTEPSVFALFSTDQIFMNRLMQEVIKVTKQCINQSHDPIILTKEQLSNKLVTDFKDELTKRTILVINNVEEALPDNVPSLHSFCDTYNPLVSKSIIFLTIKVPKSPSGKPVEYITEYLNDRWKSIEHNKREPLITRMIDQTFFLKP